MAEFRIDQATPGAGVAGRSRHDLIAGEVVTLTATSPVGVGVSYTWEILDKVGSTATISGSGITVTVGPALQIVQPCAFRVRLTANDNGTITSTIRIFSVVTANYGLRIPLHGESAPKSATLTLNDPDDSEDNAVYADRAGLGSSGQNWRGWSEWVYTITTVVDSITGGGGGGPPSGSAGGDLGGTYPNPSVQRLRGVALDSTAGTPSTGQVLRYDGTNYKPVALVTSTVPVNVTKAAASAGSSAEPARQDHKHDVTTASATSINTRANAEGSASSLARSDHTHEIVLTTQEVAADAPLAEITGVVILTAGGVSIDLPNPANVVGNPPVEFFQMAGGNVALVRFGSESIDGDAADKLMTVGNGGRWRLFSDGTDWYTQICNPTDTTTVPSNVDTSAGSAGSSMRASPANHKHSISTGSPVAFARALSAGSSETVSRADHVHDAGRIVLAHATSATTALPEADAILVDTSGGNVTMTLPTTPAGSSGRQYAIKKTNTGTNTITLDPPGAVEIEGANANYLLPGSDSADRPAWTLIYDAANDEWWVL